MNFFFVSLVEHHFSFVVHFCSLRSWQLFLRKSKMLENMFQVLSSLRSVIVVIFLRWLSFSFGFHRCKYVLLCSLFSLIFVNSNAITISFCSTTLKDTMRWFPWNHWKKYIYYIAHCVVVVVVVFQRILLARWLPLLDGIQALAFFRSFVRINVNMVSEWLNMFGCRVVSSSCSINARRGKITCFCQANGSKNVYAMCINFDYTSSGVH